MFEGTPVISADFDRPDVDARTGVRCRSSTASAGARCQLHGLRLLSHAGDVGAPGAYGSSGSQFMLAPERHLAVGVLANLSSFEKAEIAQDTLTILLGGVPAARPVPPDWRQPTFAARSRRVDELRRRLPLVSAASHLP